MESKPESPYEVSIIQEKERHSSAEKPHSRYSKDHQKLLQVIKGQQQRIKKLEEQV